MLIIFGGTGNLVKDKILSALKEIKAKNVVLLGRNHRNILENYDSEDIVYIKHAIGEDVSEIIKEIKKKTEENEVINVYIAVINADSELLMKVFEDIRNISQAINNKIKVFIDKPLGNGVNSSKNIINAIKNTGLYYRFVDHYLYKSFTVAPGPHKHVLVKFTEIKGLSPDKSMFEQAGGILGDVVQSHVLQMLKHVLCIDLDQERFSDFKVKFIKCLPGELYAIYITFAFKYTYDNGEIGDINVRCGKYAISNKCCMEINKRNLVNISNGDEAPYKLLMQDIISGNEIRSVSEKDIINSWIIIDKIRNWRYQ